MGLRGPQPSLLPHSGCVFSPALAAARYAPAAFQTTGAVYDVVERRGDWAPACEFIEVADGGIVLRDGARPELCMCRGVRGDVDVEVEKCRWRAEWWGEQSKKFLRERLRDAGLWLATSKLELGYSGHA
jgi:hypothetical protein